MRKRKFRIPQCEIFITLALIAILILTSQTIFAKDELQEPQSDSSIIESGMINPDNISTANYFENNKFAIYVSGENAPSNDDLVVEWTFLLIFKTDDRSAKLHLNRRMNNSDIEPGDLINFDRTNYQYINGQTGTYSLKPSSKLNYIKLKFKLYGGNKESDGKKGFIASVKNYAFNQHFSHEFKNEDYHLYTPAYKNASRLNAEQQNNLTDIFAYNALITNNHWADSSLIEGAAAIGGNTTISGQKYSGILNSQPFSYGSIFHNTETTNGIGVLDRNKVALLLAGTHRNYTDTGNDWSPKIYSKIGDFDDSNKKVSSWLVVPKEQAGRANASDSTLKETGWTQRAEEDGYRAKYKENNLFYTNEMQSILTSLNVKKAAYMGLMNRIKDEYFDLEHSSHLQSHANKSIKGQFVEEEVPGEQSPTAANKSVLRSFSFPYRIFRYGGDRIAFIDADAATITGPSLDNSEVAYLPKIGFQSDLIKNNPDLQQVIIYSHKPNAIFTAIKDTTYDDRNLSTKVSYLLPNTTQLTSFTGKDNSVPVLPEEEAFTKKQNPFILAKEQYLNRSGVFIPGSVLAPKATIALISSSINGNVWAKNLYQSNESYINNFPNTFIEKQVDHFEIRKTDERDTPLSGVEFELVKLDAQHQVDKNYVPKVLKTDSNGKLLFRTADSSEKAPERTELEPGTYRLRETKPLPSYAESEIKNWFIELDEEGSYGFKMDSLDSEPHQHLKIENKKISFSIKKVDPDGKVLPGANFDISDVTNADKPDAKIPGKSIKPKLKMLTTAVDGKLVPNGRFVVKNLLRGHKYKLTEILAPDGYELSSNYWIVSVDQKGEISVKRYQSDSDIGIDEKCVKGYMTVINQPKTEMMNLEFLNVDQDDRPLVGGGFVIAARGVDALKLPALPKLSNKLNASLVPEEGRFQIENLIPNVEYEMTQTEFRPHYESEDDLSWTLKVIKKDKEFILSIKGNNELSANALHIIQSTESDKITKFKIINEKVKPVLLPRTGGNGIVSYIMIGFVILLFGKFFLNLYKK